MAEAQGNQAPKAGQGTDPPEGSTQQGNPSDVVTSEQVNNAIQGRFIAFEKRLNKSAAEREVALAEKLSASLAEILGKSFEEKLAALKPQEQPPTDPGKVKDAAASDIGNHPRVQALEAELASLKKQSETAQKRQVEAERQAAAERAKARASALRQAVAEGLSKVGITGDRAELATDHLVENKRLVTYADDVDDELVFVDGDQRRPLHEGLSLWARTPKAKLFLPPIDANGSGSPPGGRGGNGTDDKNPRRIAGLLIGDALSGRTS